MQLVQWLAHSRGRHSQANADKMNSTTNNSRAENSYQRGSMLEPMAHQDEKCSLYKVLHGQCHAHSPIEREERVASCRSKEIFSHEITHERLSGKRGIGCLCSPDRHGARKIFPKQVSHELELEGEMRSQKAERRVSGTTKAQRLEHNS